MSHPLCHAGRMKIKKSFRTRAINFNLWPNGQWCHHRHALVARFGPARLIRKPDGRHELIGGTADHRATAREWCSLFAPEIVFAGGQTTAKAEKSTWLDHQRPNSQHALAT